MSEPRTRSVRVRTFEPEDQEALLEETILEWRALGPTAAWNPIYNMLGWWFAARGLDPEAQRVERTHLEVHPVPWAIGETTTTTDAGEVGPSNINLEDLLIAKLHAGRPQDLGDAAKLKKALEPERNQQEAATPKPAAPKPKPRRRRGTRGQKSDRGGRGPASKR
jgi:hypothetical protein